MKSFAAAFLILASICSAELTREQKLHDFQQLASLYAKHYAPYEWKKDVQKFDLLAITGWLDRVARSKDDLEFYDICIEYVANLNDGHVNFLLLSDFTATLGFSVDIYDSVVMVDAISTLRLPPSQYPIRVGDEVVSIDGVSVEKLVPEFAKYAVSANSRSTARLAAALLTSRSQRRIPRTAELKDEAVVVFRSPEGVEKTLTVPWVKTGTPLLSAGPVLSPKGSLAKMSFRQPESYLQPGDQPYMLPLRMLQNARTENTGVLGMGARTPQFQMPASFTQRLGRSTNDFFFSGTLESDGVKLGFIRVPNFSPASTALALQQFEDEILFFQENTDGLIVDDTRNTGGSVCLVEDLLSYLIPQPFRGAAFEIRATSYWVAQFSSIITQLQALGAPQDLIDQYKELLTAVQDANNRNRGRTDGISLCSTSTTVEPAIDRSGAVIAYTKPVVMLADDLSASSGDLFPALFQDAKRGPVIGYRTMGLGGTVVTFPDATTFSEGDARITLSMMTRSNSTAVDAFPSSPYLENVGVRPDLVLDSQTRDNLINGGRPWFEAAAWLAAQHVKANQ